MDELPPNADAPTPVQTKRKSVFRRIGHWLLQAARMPDSQRRVEARLEALARQIDETTKQNQDLLNRLRLVKRLLIIREIAPELVKSFTPELFDMSPTALEDIRTTWGRRDADLREIMNSFVAETEAMATPLNTYETEVDNEILRRIHTELIARQTKHAPHCWLALVQNLICHGEVDGELGDVFDGVETQPSAWLTMPHTIWLHDIAFRLLQGQRDQAGALLEQYMKHHQLRGVAALLPVARFAREYGVGDAAVARAAAIFEAMETSEREGLFAECIRGRSVALVGNGPQEIGSGRGAAIDAHDVVIRFNSYRVDPQFTRDYGRKTDMAVMNIHHATRDLKDRNVQYLLLGENLYYHFLDTPRLDSLHRHLTVYGCRLLHHPIRKRGALERLTGLKMPSMGLRVLHLVLESEARFSMDDCYGFSFKDEVVEPKKMNHYFKLDQQGYLIENLAKEKEAILKLFAERRDRN